MAQDGETTVQAVLDRPLQSAKPLSYSHFVCPWNFDPTAYEDSKDDCVVYQLSRQLEEKQGDLGEKARILRARADAATNEATALRAELKREKEKNEAIKNAAEKNDATEARLKALTVEAKRAREEAKKLKTEMDSRVGFETKQVQRELANERARSAKELAWFQSEMREMSAACDAAMAAARE